MNSAKVAAALNTISVAFGELAEALIEQPRAGVVPPAPAPADTIDLPDEAFEGEGHESVCPAHHKPYVEGQYGPYCPGKGIDPAWTNKRGYCTLTPKNAAVYLQAHA